MKIQLEQHEAVAVATSINKYIQRYIDVPLENEMVDAFEVEHEVNRNLKDGILLCEVSYTGKYWEVFNCLLGINGDNYKLTADSESEIANWVTF